MLFTQFEFIFIYLPVTLAGYLFLGARFGGSWPRLAWLGVCSLVFYGYLDHHFVPIIVTSILLNYTFGITIGAHPRGSRGRAIAFALAIVGNLAALGFYKYANFGIGILNGIGWKIPFAEIALPLGISFFTFTQIAYLADVYGGYPSERSFTKYALFVTYFPHLVAGPILHHREMMPQFSSPSAARFSPERTALGLTIFGIGLFKKAIIADGFALIANPVFLAAKMAVVTPQEAWAGALSYSLQIYFDFSGYCDMAIGLSLLFGIILPFNFDAPYKSRSIVEFWRRWHITLSRFLRDYLYIPLGGNRQGPSRRTVNLFATMLLGGLWHGAGWTFIAWGALHGAYLMINHSWLTWVRRHAALSRLSSGPVYAFGALLLTQLAVVVAWVFFRAESWKAAINVLAAMIGTRPSLGAAATIGITPLHFLPIMLGYAVCLLLPNVNAMFEKWHVGLTTYDTPRPWSLVALRWRPTVPWALAALVILASSVLVSMLAGDGSQFLYFQF